jgi:mannose-6-phosphate isomerase-like protein (cupin superfamily)
MATDQTNRPNTFDFLIRCPDLSSALDFYTGEAGFRLDMIYPADNPRIAELSGHDKSICLESEGPATRANSIQAGKVIICASDNQSWSEGRAGMQYRDLLPGRLGGRFIASHIRIPDGGPVADYVHHHQVNFQMIYCYRGWVRVVYEDQGEPFIMHPGDCVLQPPHIRHRVLESSDGTEVIEIGSPAEHETRVDHELKLPNERFNPERKFDGQRFVYHHAARAPWLPGLFSGFVIRDTGVFAATGGLASAMVLRPEGRREIPGNTDENSFFFNFVLQGSMDLAVPDAENRTLESAECFLLPAHTPYTLSNLSSDLELLRVTLA